AQSAGKLPLPDGDFIAACAHKLGGPPGIGVRLVRDITTLEPSGGQEKGYRRGTQDVPGAQAFAAALSVPYDLDCLARLRSRLEAGVKSAGGMVIGEESPRIAIIGAVSLPGASSSSLLVQLDICGIAVSAGSACSSGTMKRSEVLAAMDVPVEIGDSAIRASSVRDSSECDFDRAVTACSGTA